MGENITWSKNANYEKLSDNYDKVPKRNKQKKEEIKEIKIDKKLLKKSLDNFKKSYETNPQNEVYSAIVVMENIYNNIN